MSLRDMSSQDFGTARNNIIAGATVPAAIATVAVLFRVISRHSSHTIGVDDWFCLIALTIFYGLYAGVLVWVTDGSLGQTQTGLSSKQSENFRKISWIVQILYILAVTPTKLAFLFFYRRLFNSRAFRILTAIVVTAVVLWCLAALLSTILTCQPVYSYWQLSSRLHCLSSYSLDLGVGITNILLNIFIISMPVPILWRLEMSLAPRLILLFMFGFGMLVAVASILRMSYLLQVEESNISGTIVNAAIFTCIEPSVAILCSCMPTFPHLIARMRRQHDNSSSEDGQTNRSPSAATKRSCGSTISSDALSYSEKTSIMSSHRSTPTFGIRTPSKRRGRTQQMNSMEYERALLQNLQFELGMGMKPRLRSTVQAVPKKHNTISQIDEERMEGIRVETEFTIHSWSEV